MLSIDTRHGNYMLASPDSDEAHPQALTDQSFSPGQASGEQETAPFSATLSLEPDDSHRLASLCGPFDRNLAHLEQRLGVSIRTRSNRFHVSGPDERVHAASAVLCKLYQETAEGRPVDPELVHLSLQESAVEALLEDGADTATAPGANVISTRRKQVRPRGANQVAYVRAIRSADINFGIGPAGTGKTYLAVAAAVEALENHRVSRLVLVRPAVEAGEKLGFLPGDLAQKIDPYLRPLYDALYELMGVERVNKAIERHVIEVAPLAYMRGRTLNDAFIILDESQNATAAQMKMFLTRIGFGAKAVITGDVTQIDLPRGQVSGLVNACTVLKQVSGVRFTHFGSGDVVRHPLVKRIVDAYAAEPRPGEPGDHVAG